MSNLKKTLQQKVTEMSVRLPIMENRDKGETEELLDKAVVIRDYGFIKGDKGQYAVFVVDENPKSFYFAGMVLTDLLETLEADGYHEEILAEGLPIRLYEQKSKAGKKYVNVETYPQTK